MSFQPELKRSGAFEVLYHWKGEIRECSRCNIFFIDQDNVIHTPRNEMLRGITRKQVIALAAAHELPLVERDINMDEIPTMAGAFLTATTKGVLPVVRIDQQIIGDGQVHPLAQKLQSLYEKRVREYLVKALQKQS